MAATGMRSSNAGSEALQRLMAAGRIVYPRLGSRSPQRALRILRPLTDAERRDHRLDAFATLGSYDTGMKCIVCQEARVFDGITQCLECRQKCDNSKPG